ncbi:hypothetical protein K933_05158 [Candidatus Halobonum tyrrellensis G22]|uniref:TIGR00341 family protein n=2 Tax=Candidatus Halobonum TaxID=1431544 RepID=V4GVM4_9EURY|nr:hypothetical protein K933_05158 [Candidatus Halobonum tyrrellensis G22]
MVPAGKRQTVLSVLDDEGIDYAISDETSGRDYTAIVSFPLPVGAVEPVLGKLREAGLERDAYTVVVDAETVISKRFERLEEQYQQEGNGDNRIAREEIIADAGDMAPDWMPFLVMTAISSIVATAGLLLDSPAVVVGSMVIAPLVGPAMATSVGTVVNDSEMFKRGVRLQAVGLLLAIGSAAVFAAVLRFTHAVPFTVEEVFALGEVRERLAPDVLSLPIAIGAGVAGAISLSSGVSAALVGVMIAAALVPPIAVVGIGIAWGQPMAISGSAMLVVVNFLSINLAAIVVLWYRGYRPDNLFQFSDARTRALKRVSVLAIVILLATSVLGAVTVASYESAQFETAVENEARTLVGPAETVLDVEVTYGGYPIRQPTAATVTVGYPLGADPKPIADALAERLSGDRTALLGLGPSAEVDISVRYLPTQTAETRGETDPGDPGSGGNESGGADDNGTRTPVPTPSDHTALG